MPITSATFQISANTTIKAGNERISIGDIQKRGGVYKASNGSIWKLGSAVKNDKGQTVYPVTMSSRFGNIAAYNMKPGKATLTGFAEYKKNTFSKDEVFKYSSTFGAQTKGSIRFDDAFKSNKTVNGTVFEAADSKTLANDLKLARKKQWIGWKAPTLSDDELSFLMDHRYHANFQDEAREIFRPNNDPEAIKTAIKSFQTKYETRNYSSGEEGRLNYMKSLVDQKLISQRELRGLIAMEVHRDTSSKGRESERRSEQFTQLFKLADRVVDYDVSTTKATIKPKATPDDKAALRNFVHELTADALKRPDNLQEIEFQDVDKGSKKPKQSNNLVEANRKLLAGVIDEALNDEQLAGAITATLFGLSYALDQLSQDQADALNKILSNKKGTRENVLQFCKELKQKDGLDVRDLNTSARRNLDAVEKLGLKTENTIGDGNCMYHAVAKQVPPKDLKVDKQQDKTSQQHIRNDLASQLRLNQQNTTFSYLPIIPPNFKEEIGKGDDKLNFESHVPPDSLSKKEVSEKVEKSCQHSGQVERWGDSSMAPQLAAVYGRPVIVIGHPDSGLYVYDKTVKQPGGAIIKHDVPTDPNHVVMKQDPIIIVHNGTNHWENAVKKG